MRHFVKKYSEEEQTKKVIKIRMLIMNSRSMKNFNDRKSRLSLFFPQQSRKKCVTKKNFAKKYVHPWLHSPHFLVLLVNGTPIVLQFNSIFTFGRFVYHHKWCQSIYHLTAQFFFYFFFFQSFIVPGG